MKPSECIFFPVYMLAPHESHFHFYGHFGRFYLDFFFLFSMQRCGVGVLILHNPRNDQQRGELPLTINIYNNNSLPVIMIMGSLTHRHGLTMSRVSCVC